MTLVTGFHLVFGDGVGIDPAVNERVQALARALISEPLQGVTDVIPSYTTLYLEFDRQRLSEKEVRAWASSKEAAAGASSGRTVRLPMRYDGVDLESIAKHAGIDVNEVVRRHCAVHYRVYALGFTPGFPFMGEVDPLIRSPRHHVPRPRVEANTVAIADVQCGIYPLPSPGGWKLVGTALDSIYDPHRDPPFLLEPGDTVVFEPSEGAAPGPVEPLALLPPVPGYPVLQVREPGLLDLVVDAGRFRAGRFGMARSGPLDATCARIANHLVGNAGHAPQLEINVRGPVLEVTHSCVLAFAGWGVTPHLNGGAVRPFASFEVSAGDVLSFPPQKHGVRGYLALAGGIESDSFLGSASVDARGLVGRPLRAEDVLGVVQRRSVRPGRSFEPYRRHGETVTLRLEPGPQADDAALDALTRAPIRVLHADRMGLQLDEIDVAGGTVLSEATPIGAVQITPGGKPMMLLHDRGTIGGYAKPAVVHPLDLPRAGQLRAGDLVRFLWVGPHSPNRI